MPGTINKRDQIPAPLKQTINKGKQMSNNKYSKKKEKPNQTNKKQGNNEKAGWGRRGGLLLW